MSQLFDRFGRLMRSMANQPPQENPDFGDPALREAWDELEDFLKGDAAKPRDSKLRVPPEELRPDYELLEIPFGAKGEKIEKAYREQLRRYHPDRHMRDSSAEAAATARTREIIAAYRRLRAWENEA